MDWYKHDIAAYQRATEGLSGLEDGMYRRLLDAYYQREGPLPKDMRLIYALTHASTRHEKAAVGKALRQFMVIVKGSYTNPRADKEINEYNDKRNANAHAAAMRWHMRPHMQIDREIERSCTTDSPTRPNPNLCEVPNCTQPAKFWSTRGTHPRCPKHWPV